MIIRSHRSHKQTAPILPYPVEQEFPQKRRIAVRFPRNSRCIHQLRGNGAIDRFISHGNHVESLHGQEFDCLLSVIRVWKSTADTFQECSILDEGRSCQTLILR